MKNNGMTVPELVIAVAMLSAFTGVFVLVIEFTSRFFSTSRPEIEGATGVLVDHHHIYMAMDNLAEILSQPGYRLDELRKISNRCDYPPAPPQRIWGLVGSEKRYFPEGYILCLFSTSFVESSLIELASGLKDARPGIYILYATPPKDKISVNALPVRRLFCRPKPYC